MDTKSSSLTPMLSSPEVHIFFLSLTNDATLFDQGSFVCGGPFRHRTLVGVEVLA